MDRFAGWGGATLYTLYTLSSTLYTSYILNILYNLYTLYSSYTLYIIHTRENGKFAKANGKMGKLAKTKGKREKIGSDFCALGNQSARSHANETKRNDFLVGLTPRPPIYAALAVW